MKIWTIEEEEYLRKSLILGDKTVQDIADDLNRGKGSITRKMKALNLRVIPKKKYMPTIVNEEKDFLTNENTISIMELSNYSCRWPYGKDNIKYCGKKILHSSYCEDHAIKAYPNFKPTIHKS